MKNYNNKITTRPIHTARLQLNTLAGKRRLLLASCLTLISLFLISQANAAAQLMVSPTRIVFEGPDRTKQENLINNVSDSGRF